MKRYFLYFLICSFFGINAKAQLFDVVSNYAFKEGEKLEYSVGYGFIKAAEATLEVKATSETFNNRGAFHVVANGKTTGGFRTLFKVDDEFESYIDKYALVPWLFKENINEGRYRRLVDNHFNHFEKEVFIDKKKKGPSKRTLPIPTGVHDFISAMYYARSIATEEADSKKKFAFTIFLQDTVFDVAVEFIEREEVKTKAGKFKCLKYKIGVLEGGFFAEGGDTYLWVTDDKNRIPVQVTVDLFLGSMYVELSKYSGTKYPLLSKVSS